MDTFKTIDTLFVKYNLEEARLLQQITGLVYAHVYVTIVFWLTSTFMLFFGIAAKQTSLFITLLPLVKIIPNLYSNEISSIRTKESVVN